MDDVKPAGAEAEVERLDVDDDLVPHLSAPDQPNVGDRPAGAGDRRHATVRWPVIEPAHRADEFDRQALLGWIARARGAGGDLVPGFLQTRRGRLIDVHDDGAAELQHRRCKLPGRARQGCRRLVEQRERHVQHRLKGGDAHALARLVVALGAIGHVDHLKALSEQGVCIRGAAA